MAQQSPTDRTRQTDIRLIGWWQHLPRPLHPYLYLARFDRPIGWWLLLLPAWWVIPLGANIGAGSMEQAITLMVLFLVGAVSMRAAGCVINDMWDRRIDLRVERTSIRPLAAGSVSMVQAFAFLALLSLVGLFVLLQLPIGAVIVGVASCPLIIVYPLAKRVTWWPQFVLGLTFSWGVPLGWAAITGGWPPAEIWLLYAGTVCWVFGYDTIYAVQDMADDIKVGVKSSALGLGAWLHRGIGIAYAVSIIGIGGGLYLAAGAGVWMAGIAGMAVHFIWQVRKLRSDNPAGALVLFKSNRDAGLILTASLMVDLFLKTA